MRIRFLAVGVIALLLMGCNILNSPSDSAAFLWMVDGQSFQPSSNGTKAVRSASSIVVTGANCDSGAKLTLTLFTNLTPGSYPVGSEFTVTWTPDSRTSATANTWWEANATRGSGSLTITTNTSDRIVGRLSVVLGPGAGSSNAIGPKSLQGEFDLDFSDGSTC